MKMAGNIIIISLYTRKVVNKEYSEFFHYKENTDFTT